MIRMLKTQWFFYWAILIACSFTCLALNTDNKQPFHIEADAVQINHQAGINIYQGHVKATQGTTELTANKVTVYNDKNNQLTLVIAEGKRAIYRTLPERNRAEFIAKGETIQYFPSKSFIVLLGNAEAYQAPNVFKGPRIEYNIASQVVTSPASKAGRTTIILDPKKLG